MSTSIDERVVYMKFDNKNFENNAQDSLRTLDKLKSSLNFKDVQSKLNDVDLSGLKRSMGSMFDNVDTSKMVSAIDKLEYRMSTLGQFTGRIVQNVADDIYSVIKKALSGIDQVVDYASSGIIQGGYRRASNIQTAKFQLEGLGISWNEIKDDIDFAVTNTAYSLDQAALVAANLTTAGLRPGKEWVDLSGNLRDEDLLAMVLRSISGTAASTGGRSDYSDIGRILTQMVSLGKVNQQQLNELSYRGIAANDVVAEYFSKIAYEGRTDWTAADIREITGSRDSTLSPYVVIEALYEKFGEHAVKANETLSGVMANTKSALARIGENFFEPIIENNGPLVHAFEVLRQSINDLNTAIKPVISAFGKDVAGVIGKFADNFLDKTLVVDEEGNAVLDSSGKEQYTYSLKKKGGLFSDFVEDLYVGEWKEKGIPGQSDHTYVDFDGEVTTRAAIIAENLRLSAINTMETLRLIATAIGDAFHAVFPNADSFAETLVKISVKIREITDAWKNSPFLKDGAYEKSGLFRILRGLAAGIDIVIQFGSSFKKHIIDPIFNKGKEAAEKSGLGGFFLKFFDSIYEFDQKIKNFDGDYFGLFFEKTKVIFGKIRDVVQKGFKFISDKFEIIKPKLAAFFDFIKPKVKSAFDSIVNWWKPVKDILVNSDLSIQEKWDAIKKYFKDNFEIPGMDKLRSLRDFFSEHFDMPGWDNVKDFFSTIGDTIGKGWAKVKEIFGFGKKEDEISLTTAGAGLSGNNGLFGNAGKVETNLTISQALNMLDKDTEKMPTIMERIKGFFDGIKEVFTDFDVDGTKAVLLGFVIVFGVAFVTITSFIYKIFKTLTTVVFNLPRLTERLLTSFNELINGITATMRASRVEIYSDALKNIAESIAILALVFLAISAFILLADKIDPSGNYVDKLITVGAVIGIVTTVLGVIIAALAAYADTMNKIVTITKAGLNIVTETAAFAGIAAVITALVTGIVIISGVIFALSFMDEKKFTDGLKRLAIVATILFGMTAILMVLARIVGVFKSIKGFQMNNGSKVAKSMAVNLLGIASIINAISIGLVVLTGLIAVYGYLFTDSKKFWTGVGYLAVVGGLLVALVAGVLYVIRRVERIDIKREISVPKLVGIFAGMIAILGAIATGIVFLSGILIILSKVASSDTGAFWSGIAALVVIGGLMVAIPTLLMKFNATAMYSEINAGNLFKLAGSIAVLSVAALIMAKALSLVADLDTEGVLASAAAIGGLMLACMLLTGVIIGISNSDKDAAKTGLETVLAMSLMLAALYPVALAIEKIANMEFGDYIAGVFGIIGVLGAVALVALALNHFIKDADIDGKKLISAASTMAIMAIALIPIGAALGLLFMSLDGRTINNDNLITSLAGLGVIFFVMAKVTKGLIDSMPKDLNYKGLLSSIGGVMGLSLALIPIIGAVALLMLVINRSPNIDPWMVLSILAGISLTVVALGAAAMFIAATATRQLTDTNSKAMNKLSQIIFTMLAGLMGVATVISLFVLTMHAFNISPGEIGYATVSLAALTTLIVGLGMAVSEVANNQKVNLLSDEKYANMFKSIGIVIASVLIAAASISLINMTSAGGWSTLQNVVPLILTLGVVIGAVAGILAIANSKLINVNSLSKLPLMLATIAVVTGAIFVLAGAIVLLNRFAPENIWESFGIVSLLGAVLTGMTALFAVISKIPFNPFQLSALITNMIPVVILVGALTGVVILLNRFTKGNIWAAFGVVSLLGVVLTAMIALLATISLMPFDPVKMKSLIIGLVGCVVAIGGLAIAMRLLSDMNWESIAGKLAVFVIAILALAAGIALLGQIPGAGFAWASMGTMLVGLGITLAGAGALLYLSAKAFSEFTDALLNISGRDEELKSGMSAWTSAIVAGFVTGLHEFNVQWPNIQREIDTFLNTIFPWLETKLGQLLDHLKTQIGTIIGALADLVADPEIQEDLASIITNLLDWLDDHVEDWSEKLVSIGAKICKGIAKGIVHALPIELANSTITDTNYDIAFADNLDEIYDKLEESLHQYYLKAGYLEQDWNKFVNSTKFEGLQALLANAMVFGDQDAIDYLNSIGGYQNAINAAFSSIEKETGAYTKNDRRRYEGLFNPENQNKLKMLSSYGFDTSEIENILSGIDIALSAGGDWQSGITELEDYLSSLLETIDDPETRLKFLIAAQNMGLQLHIGSEFAYPAWLSGAETAKSKYGKIFDSDSDRKDMFDNGQSFLNAYIEGAKKALNLKDLKSYKNSIPYLIGQATVKAQRIGMLEEEAAQGGADGWVAEMKLKVARADLNSIMNEIKESSAEQASEVAATATEAIEKEPINANPTANVDPQINVNYTEEDADGVASEIGGTTETSLSNDFRSRAWGDVATNILNGIFNKLKDDDELLKRADEAAEKMRDKLDEGIRHKFHMRSPTRDPKLLKDADNIGLGIFNRIQSITPGLADDTAGVMEGSLESSFGDIADNIDFEGFAGDIMDKLRNRLPTMEELTSGFSLDKGISGNLENLKNIFGKIKDVFTNADSDISLPSIFGSLKDRVLSALGIDSDNDLGQAITDGLSNALGIDLNSIMDGSALGSDLSLESLGVNIDMSGTTFDPDANGFGGWDANDWMSNNTIDIDTNIDLDQQVLDDFLNQNTTLGLANSVPVAGGYRQSTIGSTYVNNYSYNQTNNSPTALNTREINRQNELLLNRRRRG